MQRDNEKIEQAVTKQFVCGRLRSQDVDRLDRSLDFGDDLTDSTYWEWISGRAKKLFLILNDLGWAGHIFHVIDSSLDDRDLPIALGDVKRLALTPSKDEKSMRKFYQRQFHYLVRPLSIGGHVDYGDDEVIPLDVAAKKHGAHRNHHVDKVTHPDRPDSLLYRCRISLGPGHRSWGELMSEIKGIKDVQEEHLLSYWASYTHQGYGYILFTPAPEYSLQSLLGDMPKSLKKLTKPERRQTVMNWIYCLTKAVSFLHDKGRSHGNIKPSTVVFSNNNHVFLSGSTRFQTDILRGVTDNTSFDREAYDYAAPENLFRPISPSSSGTQEPADRHSGTAATAHVSVPNQSQQAADVFSLGCVILEFLSFLLKKQGKPFAAYRAAKHKATGRGAIPDASFHKNLGQVESWMVQLAKEASEKDDPFFQSFRPMLHVVEDMLAFYPLERPTAHEVHARFYRILIKSSAASKLRCVQRDSGVDFGVGSIAPSSPGLASTGSSVDVSAQTRERDKPGDTDHKRSSGSASAGGSGSASLLSAGSSARNTGRERASSRVESAPSGRYPPMTSTTIILF